MPRKSKDLTKRELDSLRRQAQRDPEFRAMRADGGRPACASGSVAAASSSGSGPAGRVASASCGASATSAT